MPGLHLFFPENDLALAQDNASYTAPPAAVKLRRAGATLPLWYGDAGDYVIADGVNARWYNDVAGRFGLATKLYSRYSDDMTPMPWGWSKASRKAMQVRGVPTDALPSDLELDRIRELSHRRTSALIADRLAKELPMRLAPKAVEVRSFDELLERLTEYDSAVVKLPWSSSGRGIIPISLAEIDRQKQSLQGAIRRQGSLMIEPRYDKVCDFAALYTMSAGKCVYEGLSLFETSGFGSYAGNILAPQTDIHDMICESLGGADVLDAVIGHLPVVLESLIGKDYDGPLGIDMMSVRGADYSLVPVVELNLRMTMGHVCYRLYRDHIYDGCRGKYTVVPATASGVVDCDTHNGRIRSGIVDLAQPGSDFSFLVEIDRP